MNKLAAALGILQGAVLIPLSLYLALLVRNDLSARLSAGHQALASAAGLIVMVLCLVMSYSLADHLLDSITGAVQTRAALGKTWVIACFFGLVAFAIARLLIIRFKGE